MKWLCDPLPDKKHIACMRIKTRAFLSDNKISQYTSSIFPQFQISHGKKQAPSDKHSHDLSCLVTMIHWLLKEYKIVIIRTYYSCSTDDINKVMVT